MTVLIIEDEEHLALGLKYNMEAEGFGVDVVGDGTTAISLFREHPDKYSVVILDLMLPGMSGYQICQELREISPTVPILVLSARSLSEDRTRAFDLGVDQYMTKPFDLQELLSRVRNLTDRERRGVRRGIADEIYEFANVQVDFRRMDAIVAGKPKKLTPMEFKLLELFVRHQGEVLSRSEILQKVWNISPAPATRTVDNFVMRLRKAFEKDPADPKHFVSVRGAGYRFSPSGQSFGDSSEETVTDPSVL